MAHDFSSSIAPLVAGAFTLAGVWLGSFLSQRNSERQTRRLRMSDLRIRSYAKLMGLKIAITQAVQTNGEAKLLSEYYASRHHITRFADDLEEAKRQNARALSGIPEIAKIRREIFELLGEVKIAFPESDHLNQAVHAVYCTSSIDVPEVRGAILTVEALDAWKIEAVKVLTKVVEHEYSEKIECLLTILYPATNKA